MKRVIYILLTTLLVLCCGGATSTAYGQRKRVNAEGKELTPVDIKSRRTRPIPVGDTTGYALTGDVVLYHNGAVITCDSVVRYNEREMSCFGNVIIKKDDTFIYGDRAEYSRDRGEARVFSPLIKVRNEDATLYTYNLVFNTAENIGRFYGGGTFSNGENRMESEKGYFYADLDEVVGVDRVEMKNETYEMKSDSVNYNTEKEIAKYFTRSVTWKRDGEILSSDNGEYHNNEQRYLFRQNAYVMGEKQEMWADTVDYRELVQIIELKHNAQIRDEEHKSIIFGHYGKYDDASGDTFLTQNPVYISYGDSDGNGTNDTIYMRSDSMFVYMVDSLGYCTLTRPDSATIAQEIAARAQAIIDKHRDDSTRIANLRVEISNMDSLARLAVEQRALELDSLSGVRTEIIRSRMNDSLNEVFHRVKLQIDSLEKVPEVDSVQLSTTDSLTHLLDSLVVAFENPVADSMSQKETDDRVMLGLRDVKVFRSDFQGICDSMLMFSVDSTAQLHNNSVMWNELNQITSQRADVYTRNQKPYKVIFSEGKPLMSSEIDTTRYNQVAGKTIESLFNDGVMYRTDITGNAQTYYYMVDDADGALMGYLVAESADMTFFIVDNTVDGIMYRGDPEYTIYPMDQIPPDQPQRMPEFVWHIKSRPTAEGIVGDWMINPSERSRYMAMRRPQFPITYSIERYRESLIAGGSWADRDDDISDMAKDFIERVKDK